MADAHTHHPLVPVERLVRATNAHDLDAIVACFAEDYRLEAPLHPQRSFQGSSQVRRNWSQLLAAVPDLQAKLVRSAVGSDSVWTEWEMAGTRRDGVAHCMRGVFIFGIANDRIQWGRMFLEPVDTAGGDMDKAVRDQLAGTAGKGGTKA